MNKELLAIKKQIAPILREYRVSKAGIFGSYARGDNKKKSDVDILVEIENGTDLIELIRLKNKLQKTIKKRVDLVEYNSIRKEIKSSVLHDEIQIL